MKNFIENIPKNLLLLQNHNNLVKIAMLKWASQGGGGVCRGKSRMAT
ncbi:MAG: hypothetical protein LBK82_14835 [Planctomycetaceae bacterium]|nr:hypothetical protein [Planctomycetaceae bacterium]